MISRMTETNTILEAGADVSHAAVHGSQKQGSPSVDGKGCDAYQGDAGGDVS